MAKQIVLPAEAVSATSRALLAPSHSHGKDSQTPVSCTSSGRGAMLSPGASPSEHQGLKLVVKNTMLEFEMAMDPGGGVDDQRQRSFTDPPVGSPKIWFGAREEKKRLSVNSTSMEMDMECVEVTSDSTDFDNLVDLAGLMPPDLAPGLVPTSPTVYINGSLAGPEMMHNGYPIQHDPHHFHMPGGGSPKELTAQADVDKDNAAAEVVAAAVLKRNREFALQQLLGFGPPPIAAGQQQWGPMPNGGCGYAPLGGGWPQGTQSSPTNSPVARVSPPAMIPGPVGIKAPADDTKDKKHKSPKSPLSDPTQGQSRQKEQRKQKEPHAPSEETLPIEMDPATELATIPQDCWTTVMLRNLPNDYTRTMLLELLDTEGFERCYDFLYMPIDFHRKAGLGYAFVNMVTHADAESLMERLKSFDKWQTPSQKLLDVCWSEPSQGLEAQIERYRNSPVMHPDVEDKYKPLLLQGGVSVIFPGPTKRIRLPRLKHGSHR